MKLLTGSICFPLPEVGDSHKVCAKTGVRASAAGPGHGFDLCPLAGGATKAEGGGRLPKVVPNLPDGAHESNPSRFCLFLGSELGDWKVLA